MSESTIDILAISVLTGIVIGIFSLIYPLLRVFKRKE